MNRSLFSLNSLGLGRQNADAFEEDVWPGPRRFYGGEEGPKRKLWDRLPWLVKLIAWLFCATAGVIIAILGWLIYGALTWMPQV